MKKKFDEIKVIYLLFFNLSIRIINIIYIKTSSITFRSYKSLSILIYTIVKVISNYREKEMSQLHKRNQQEDNQNNNENNNEKKPIIEIQDISQKKSNDNNNNDNNTEVKRNTLGMIVDEDDDGYLKKEEIPIYIKEICKVLFYVSIPIIIISCILAFLSMYYLYSKSK